MGDEQAPVLAYAASVARPSFFRPLWANLPFSGGMFLGLLVAGVVLACQPDLSRPAPTFE
jgi:demethoxyubiquinone hydroxylase (CLK1/Coq7/Cat5 family)